MRSQQTCQMNTMSCIWNSKTKNPYSRVTSRQISWSFTVDSAENRCCECRQRNYDVVCSFTQCFRTSSDAVAVGLPGAWLDNTNAGDVRAQGSRAPLEAPAERGSSWRFATRRTASLYATAGACSPPVPRVFTVCATRAPRRGAPRSPRPAAVGRGSSPRSCTRCSRPTSARAASRPARPPPRRRRSAAGRT